MHILSVSIGICAYNEEKNIRDILVSLLGQRCIHVHIEEIIVISDGSTDQTNDIVRSFSDQNKIKPIIFKERRGKFAAINEFLHHAKSSILVLSSADVVLDECAIENLCAPFFEDNIGATASRPIPQNPDNTFMGYVINLQWRLHHKLSCRRPKFGELIAFRRVFERLSPTLADEEEIAAILKRSGYVLRYIPQAVVYNRGPENVADFLVQRRRIFAGHLMLKRGRGYSPVTLNGFRVFKCLIGDLGPRDIKRIHWVAGAILLEVFSRGLGWSDTFLGNIDCKWKIAASTKSVTIRI